MTDVARRQSREATRRARRTGVYQREARWPEIDEDLSVLLRRIVTVRNRRWTLFVVAIMGFVAGTTIETLLEIPYVLSTWLVCFVLLFAGLVTRPWPRERIVFARKLAGALATGADPVHLNLDLRDTRDSAVELLPVRVTSDGRHLRRFVREWLALRLVLGDGARLELARREIVEDDDHAGRGTHASHSESLRFEDEVTYGPSAQGYRESSARALAGVTGKELGLPASVDVVTADVTDERVRIVVRSEPDTVANARLNRRPLLPDGSVETLLRWVGRVAPVPRLRA